MSQSSLFFTLSYFVASVSGLDNGVARTPPMGWMSWQRFRCQVDCANYPNDCIGEKLAKRTADRLLTDEWLDAGYQYLIIDDCWMAKERDPKTKKLKADPDRFPSGYHQLSRYIHSKGLKFGVYLDYGTLTCAKYPGSMNFVEIDTQSLAEWDADYVKLDGCYSEPAMQADGYESFGRHLNETGRPIVYSCSYPAYQSWLHNVSVIDWTRLAHNCNLWRFMGDIEDGWSSVLDKIQTYKRHSEFLARYAGPGHWNDPDMLVVGAYGLSKDQQRVQMGMWCMFAAPLIISLDLDHVDDYSKELLQNRQLISIDQDPAGHQATCINESQGVQYWARHLGFANDEYAIACLYTTEGGFPIQLDLRLDAFAIKVDRLYSITDVFTEQTFSISGVDEAFRVTINPNGIVMFRVSKAVELKIDL